MYIAPDFFTGDVAALPAQRLAPAADATFHVPLGRTRSGTGTLAITLTGQAQDRVEALALINRRYAGRGYGSHHRLADRGEEITLTAWCDGQLISTVTLAIDSTDGLSVDQTFPEETRFLRQQPNARLCELKKLAMERAPGVKPVLAAMFHVVFIYGTSHDLGTDLVIEVNPRHAPFYERMLKFRRVGGVRTNASVNAPSQLMWLPVSQIDAMRTPGPRRSGKSLYEYFHSGNIEDEIVSRIYEQVLASSSAIDCHQA